MLRTSIKSRLHSKKQKPRIETEVNKTQSNLPPNLKAFKQKPISGSGFLVYN